MQPLQTLAGRCLAVLLAWNFATEATAGVRLDPDPAWRSAATMADLVERLDTWLDDASPWERRAPPEVRMVSPDEALALAGQPGRGHGSARGLYDAVSGTVYLVAPWNAQHADDVSVLLHELVHHRQAAVHWACPGAQELSAYRLQDAWLAERGLRVDANWIAVVLEANCGPRDFHPD